jgi:stage II sporulation protein D
MLLEFAAITLLANAHSGKLLSGTVSKVSAHPGSAIKPFVLTALLEAKVLPAKPDYLCPGKLILEGRNFTCSHPRVFGAMDERTALAYSCNNYFVHYAALLPPGKLAATLARFGLGGISSHVTEALGEGTLTVTPAQMLEGFRRLALEQNPVVIAGLRDAVRYGTAQLAAVSGMAVAGKTGTASPSYAWFAGFAPADRPEYVFAVLTRQGSGGLGAAPLARAALLRELGRAGELAVMTQSGLQTMPLEEYVLGVLGGEASDLHSAGARKAMAVAARTFAQKLRGRHAEDGYDFCATTHCQSFRPQLATDALRSAQSETAGEFLWRDGTLAETFYSQDCSSEWNATLTAAEIRRAMYAARLHMPVTLAPRVLERDGAGRVLRLDLGDGVPLAASSFRFAIGRTVGWNRIRSDFYELHGLKFEGRGAGNGVGLCQRDADGMTGTYRQILGAFYPGTVTGLTARGIGWHVLAGERVELWSTAVEQDRGVIGDAEAALRFAEEATGWVANGKPRVQVFPTVAMFRDSTGEPGTVVASTRGRVIRLQPAGRGLGTLRHEMLHFVIEGKIRPDMPLWYREGLALTLAGGAMPGDAVYRGYRLQVEELIRVEGKLAVLRRGLRRER